jgi:hypothetical protein
MPAEYLLLGSDADSSLGFLLFVWNLMPFLYAILLFCMVHGIMTNTKRTSELLAQLLSVQPRSPGAASAESLTTPDDLPSQTLGSHLLEPESEPIPTLGLTSFFLQKQPKRKPIPPQ